MQVLSRPDSVSIVAVDGGELVVVRQTRAGAEARTLELPAGSIERLRTVGFRHMALTMLKTFPARSIAAAYSSASSPVASSTSICLMCGTALSLASGPAGCNMSPADRPKSP